MDGFILGFFFPNLPGLGIHNSDLYIIVVRLLSFMVAAFESSHDASF